MNNTTVEQICNELDKLSVDDKTIAVMISEVAPNFTSDFVNDEYEKIKLARERSLPTYRSEYRVIKTLIRQRNLLIAYIKKHPQDFPDEHALLCNLVPVSELLSAALKTVLDIFEYEKDIAGAVEDFEKVYVKNLKDFQREVTVKVKFEEF